ncbi:MAG: ABC transporter substrate-binding protein [Spirochaetaceae bacterium]|nr:MAG: ABC transporter substrate-binding protein [Spirochaetaceae bacterium]
MRRVYSLLSSRHQKRAQKYQSHSLILSVLVLAFMLTGLVSAEAAGRQEGNADSQSQDTVTVVDNAERTVTVALPVERAAVALRFNSELIRAIGANDRVIAVDMNTAQDREFWKEFNPEQTIGRGQRELNYEKIIELDPQVLILPKNGSWEEAQEVLAPFGIEVLVVSGYDTADFINQVTNLGKVFQEEEAAQEFMDWYNEVLSYIARSLEGQPRRTVFLETLNEFATTFEGDFFYDMVRFSHGEHIFRTRPHGITGTVIDPEDVIREDPDVIVKMITPDHALRGTGLSEAPLIEQRRRVINEMKNRPAWEDIAAVQNNEVYVMSQFGHGGASKLVGAAYMAKWIYGDLLPDLDPVEVERRWMEDFQGFHFVEGHFYPVPR